MLGRKVDFQLNPRSKFARVYDGLREIQRAGRKKVDTPLVFIFKASTGQKAIF
jgi:hypothetical protein